MSPVGPLGAPYETFGDGLPTVSSLPGVPSVYDDEFAGGPGHSGAEYGMAAKWQLHAGPGALVPIDTVVANLTFTPTVDGACKIVALDPLAQDVAIVQPAPAGLFALSARVQRLADAERSMWGLLVVDVSGNGVCLVVDNGGETCVRDVTNWLQTGAGTNIQPSTTAAVNAGVDAFLRLRWDGAGHFYGGATCGDKVLQPYEWERDAAIVPAWIGFGRIFQNGGPGSAWSVLALDFFRLEGLV